VADELADLLAERSMLNLTLPIGGRTIHVTARLVWTDDIEHSKECRLGLRFLDLESADQEFLWRWVLDHMDPDGPRASGSGLRQAGEAEASG
jgi:c-di-GMP-binding flagellar brake protein YcgR